MKWRVVNDDSPVNCPTCNGRGCLSEDKCGECNGEGSITIVRQINKYNYDDDTPEVTHHHCHLCKGTGSARPCPICHGKKKLRRDSICIHISKIQQLAEQLTELQNDYDQLAKAMYNIEAASREAAYIIERDLVARDDD